MTKKSVFTGSGVAIITPFNEDGINFDAFGKIIEDQIKNETDAIVVCGTTGEASTMPDKEHLSAIEYCVKKVAGRVPVIAGTGSNDTPHAVELSKEAANLGADALLCVTPYYNKTSQRGLIRHYEMVADAVNVPMILYSVKARTGLNIAPETALALADHPNIVGIKEASGDISQVAKIASLCGDKLDLYSGNDDQVLPVLSLGGIGVISVVSNVAPKAMHDMVMSYLNGDTKKATELQLGMIELVEALFCDVNPIPVKTAMNLLGYDAGHLRMPLYEMSDAGLNQLKVAMKNYGLLK